MAKKTQKSAFHKVFAILYFCPVLVVLLDAFVVTKMAITFYGMHIFAFCFLL